MSNKIIEYKSQQPKGSGCDSLTGGLEKAENWEDSHSVAKIVRFYLHQIYVNKKVSESLHLKL